jgi:excisionase family DNA binding protein
MTTGPWLDSESARLYLGLSSAKALREHVRRGTIKAYKLGRHLRFSRPELDAALSLEAPCRTSTATRPGEEPGGESTSG